MTIGVTITALTVLTAIPGAALQAELLKNERVYFHCSGPTKIGNANLVADGSIPSWDKTAPVQSVADGAGCGTADFNRVDSAVEPQENPTDGVWKGTFTGNLKELTVHAHCICLGTSRLDDAATLGVRLSIDGEPITGDGNDPHALNLIQHNLGLTQLYEFSITNIDLIEPNPDENGDGIGENPFGKIEHSLTLTLDGFFITTNTWGIWVYDTNEVPSGITFNPTTLAATVIPARQG